MRDGTALRLDPRERLRSISEKYMTFGYNGGADADRERDEVIGFLLGEIESRDDVIAGKVREVRSVAPAVLVEERLAELRGFVRERRSTRGLSLRAAAVESGVPFTTIAGFEKGERIPDSPSLLSLLAWLGLSLDWLTGGPSNAVADYRRGWDDCAAAVRAVTARCSDV